MKDAKIKAEIEDLRSKLSRYQYEYYVLAQPGVSDLEYDRLFDRLLELERQYPEFESPDSPTRRVGSDLSQNFPFFEHKIPVLSLDKCYAITELHAWIEKLRRNTSRELSFVVEEKIDGASIVLYYEKGQLVNAVTRGNGSVGNDITGNVRTIGAVPLRLPEPLDVAVRGEIFLPRKEFEHINREMEVPYANPRNLASGSLRRIKSTEVAGIPLDIFVYEGFFAKPLGEHTEILAKLRSLGFKLNPRTALFASEPGVEKHGFVARGVEELEAFAQQESAERDQLEYEIDGLVIKVDAIPVRESLGYTGHHPRWALAYKFESPAGITEVKEIHVQVGRTGRITPVATVTPVEISGSVISRVTLHNQDYINLLELALGDKVVVEKRGDVIPSAARVLEHNEENQTWQLPPLCPACDTALVKKGAHHFCPNTRCQAVVKGRLQFFTARKQMDIENLGQETVAFLYESDIIRDIEDIYTFDPGKLINFAGFGEKKIQAIRDGIAASKKQPYRTVLASLGIPELGPRVAELLIEAGLRDIADLFTLADEDNTEVLVAIPGIGEKTATHILEEFRSAALRQRVEALKAAGLNFRAGDEESAVAETEQLFREQVWCATGSFIHFKPRDKALELVKKYGGRVTGSVTGKTTHLLAGSGGGSKLSKAQELGITVLSEEEFLALLPPGNV